MPSRPGHPSLFPVSKMPKRILAELGTVMNQNTDTSSRYATRLSQSAKDRFWHEAAVSAVSKHFRSLRQTGRDVRID
jgi:hypothetical protein